VRSEVVQDDDVTTAKPRSKAAFDKVEEHPTVDRSLVGHELGALAYADRADERERPPRSSGLRSVSPEAASCPTVVAAHARAAEGLVDKNELRRVCQRDDFAELLIARAVLRGVALDCREALFFRENPRRESAR